MTTQILSKLDELSKLIPKVDELSKLVPKVDELSKLVPKVDELMQLVPKVDQLTNEVKILRSDAQSTKSTMTLMDMRTKRLEQDSKVMQVDMADMKADIRKVKADLRRLEVLHEETEGDIKQILEVVTPQLKIVTRIKEHIQSHTDTLQFHDRRLNFLEKKATA